jgi:hypothetical protein
VAENKHELEKDNREINNLQKAWTQIGEYLKHRTSRCLKFKEDRTIEKAKNGWLQSQLTCLLDTKKTFSSV